MSEQRGGPFADLLKTGGAALRKPPKVITLPLDAWADTAPDKPSAPVPIGLRLPGDEDDQRARAEAIKAVESFAAGGDLDDRIAAYNDALICERVAACACQSADVTQGFFEMAALDVRRRLTRAAIQRLWQETEAMRAGADVSMPELDVDGLAHLTAMLDREVAFQHMPREDAKRLKRLLEHVRQELQEGEARAEQAGDPLLAELAAASQPEALPGDLENVLAAMERRQAPSRLGSASR